MGKINLNREPKDNEFFFTGDHESITYIAGLLDEAGIFDEHFNYFEDGTIQVLIPIKSHDLAIERSPEYRGIFAEGKSFSAVKEV